MSTPPTKRQAVSLVDVAKAAGTSTAVVSYVLNNGPRPVSKATRERVLKEITRLGYRPNRIARALRSNKSNTLGLLMPDTTNAFFADLTHSLEKVAFARGYLSFVGNASFDAEREESYLHAFVDLQVDGMAVIDLDTRESNSELFSDLHVPIVFVHYKPEGLTGDYVRLDEVAAGQKAAEVIAAQDVDQVVIITGPSSPGPVAIRTQAFERTMGSLGSSGPFHRIETTFDRIATSHAFGEFVDKNPRPENMGAFVATDEQALGVLHAARLRELAIPDELVVVGGEGTTGGQFSAPALSSIDVPIHELAIAALDLLLARLAGSDEPAITKTLGVSYTDRGTTRRR